MYIKKHLKSSVQENIGRINGNIKAKYYKVKNRTNNNNEPEIVKYMHAYIVERA